MDQSYPPLASSAIPSKGLVAESFRRAKDAVIEEGLAKQPSWATKVGNCQSGVMLDDFEKLLDVLGLKVVDKQKTCVDRSVLLAWKTLATAAMAQPEKLTWDDES